MRHILISGGAATGSTWSRYVEFARTVRASTQKPIYQMIEPPPHLSDLQRLHDAGVNEIAVNIEIFDRTLARQYMKGKGQIPLETYLKTLEAAVEIWGNKGAVRSILIVGLEPVASTLAAVDALTQRGVLPILSPFRPVPGTGLQYVPPAGPEEMYELWTKGQEISERNGMTLGPLCVACQNNTITLPVNDHYRHY